MPSPEHPPPAPEPSAELPGYHQTSRYPSERPAGNTYEQAQALIYNRQDVDLSTYRLIYEKRWHVSVLGDIPPADVHKRVRQILGSGEPATLPDNVTPAQRAVTPRQSYPARGTKEPFARPSSGARTPAPQALGAAQGAEAWAADRLDAGATVIDFGTIAFICHAEAIPTATRLLRTGEIEPWRARRSTRVYPTSGDDVATGRFWR
jgi:hypothetical protein